MLTISPHCRLLLGIQEKGFLTFQDPGGSIEDGDDGKGSMTTAQAIPGADLLSHSNPEHVMFTCHVRV